MIQQIKGLMVRSWLTTFLSGALLTLAFAPFYLFPLAILCPMLLLMQLEAVNAGRAFRRGFVFGLGLFGTGASWVYVSIHQYGHASVLLASGLTLLFIAFLALIVALQCYAFNKFFPDNNLSKRLLVFPALWVLFEWCRSWILTGFPWLFLGTSQTLGPLKGYASIVGVYGVSFLCAFSAALLCTLISGKQRARILTTMLLLIVWGGGAFLSTISWTTPNPRALTVSLIQGNIPQEKKWLPEQRLTTLELYNSLTQAHWHSDLIVWPEAAIPVPLPQAQTYLSHLGHDAKAHDTTLLVGLPVQVKHKRRFYNGLVAVGQHEGHYFKEHLVPFGEYVPLEKVLRGLIAFFNLPMSSFVPGPANQPPLNFGHYQIAPLICYEIAFPEFTRRASLSSQLLVTVSDDSWFGHSIGPAQHLQLAQMRALETGRYVLRATNTGITAVISPKGKVIKRLPQEQSQVLTTSIDTLHGATPWMSLGTGGVMGFLAFILLAEWLVVGWIRPSKARWS